MNLSFWFVTLSVIFSAILSSVDALCPAYCNCSVPLVVNCSSTAQHTIPTDIHNDTETLYLHNNSITRLKVNSFVQLTSLITLRLDSNMIQTIDNGAFNGAESVETLNLANNKITELKEDTFSDLRKLTSLRLDVNNIASIEKKAFNGLNSLSLLKLSSNDLTQLNRDMLDGVESLKRLEADRNWISAIVDNAFTKTPQLTNLALNFNNMSEISSTFWTGLGKLQKLDLSYNRLQELKVDSFKGLTNIEHLVLDSNRIQSIEKGAFNGLDHLVSLEMSFNKLTTTRGYMLTGLRNVEFINLSLNNLTTLQENSFEECCGKVKTLLMYHNQIERLDPKWFIGLDRLNKIDLHTNKLRTIPGDIFDVLPSLNYLVITDNPLQCDCDMFDYRVWSGSHNPSAETRCHDPDQYRDRVIEQIPVKEFTYLCTSSCQTISTGAWIGIGVGCFLSGGVTTIVVGWILGRIRSKRDEDMHDLTGTH